LQLLNQTKLDRQTLVQQAVSLFANECLDSFPNDFSSLSTPTHTTTTTTTTTTPTSSMTRFNHSLKPQPLTPSRSHQSDLNLINIHNNINNNSYRINHSVDKLNVPISGPSNMSSQTLHETFSNGVSSLQSNPKMSHLVVVDV
jgi:hypothetical protein